MENLGKILVAAGLVLVVQALGLPTPARHAANSAAMLRDERTWYDFVRPGLLLYGIAPPGLDGTVPLRPVMTLRSRIVAVKGIRAGDGVGYGLRFVASAPGEIAVVPAGYTDGLDTRLANGGAVLVKGRRAPVVGSVCMDMLMIDVTGFGVSPGDEVIIIWARGTGAIDVREMAATIGTIPYELLCRGSAMPGGWLNKSLRILGRMAKCVYRWNHTFLSFRRGPASNEVRGLATEKSFAH